MVGLGSPYETAFAANTVFSCYKPTSKMSAVLQRMPSYATSLPGIARANLSRRMFLLLLVLLVTVLPLAS